MATTISIAIGAQTVSRTYQITNAKAINTLVAFYDTLNLGPAEATDQQKVEAVIDWFVKTIKDNALAKYRRDQQATVDQQGSTLYGFE